jgi:gamma-glutamyltranspeptidase/glutathione hydrolase
VESRLGEQTITELRRRGHDVTVSDAWSLGRLSAVSRDPETGLLGGRARPALWAGCRPPGRILGDDGRGA